MRFKNLGIWGLAFLLLFSFNACSNSSDSSDSTSGYETGVFLDSPVISIGYRTETLEGVTNSLGEYDYVEGETVTFFIGDLEFPSVTASATVTPLDLAGTTDTEDNVVVNIIRLLQTLDQDGNPDNGITITDEAKEAATEVDFDVDTAEFEADTDVLNLIANGGQDTAVTELISEEEAIANFEDTLDEEDIDFYPNALAGVWVYSEGDVPMVVALAILDDTNYVGAQQTLGTEGVIGGVEAGTYTLSSDGTVFSDATPVINSNAEDTVVGATITVDSDGETATISTEEGDELTISKITSTDEHPEAGLWTADGDAGDSDGEDLNIFIFDGNGNYMYVGLNYSYTGFNTLEDEGIIQNATEYGTYVISDDGTSITMTPADATDTSAVCTDDDESGCDTVAGDSNEGAGFSDLYTDIIPLTISGNTMTLVITEYADDDVSEGDSYTVTLTRIE